MEQVVWPLEPHTEAKHDILRRYLAAWFPIMATYVERTSGKRLVYIDGFAGPGRYSRGEDGSPVIALQSLLQHRFWLTKLYRLNYTFLCIEADEKRADHLKGVLSSISVPNNVKVHVELGEFERVIPQMLDTLQGALAPALFFIDPFGPQGFPMELMRRILDYRTSEMLITLNLRALNQWYLPTQAKHGQVDSLYGGDEWRQYMGMADPNLREESLRRTYQSQLKKSRNVRVRDFQMVNKHNQTAYYLVYATHHPKGLAVMKGAMWSVDPSGAFAYSDITNPNQPFLFGREFDEMHVTNCAKELLGQYAGKEVSYKDLKQAIEEHEHYIGRHLTGALDRLTSENMITPSSPKRGRGWPERTTFRFPLLPS